jgi:hypothetical protein
VDKVVNWPPYQHYPVSENCTCFYLATLATNTTARLSLSHHDKNVLATFGHQSNRSQTTRSSFSRKPRFAFLFGHVWPLVHTVFVITKFLSEIFGWEQFGKLCIKRTRLLAAFIILAVPMPLLLFAAPYFSYQYCNFLSESPSLSLTASFVLRQSPKGPWFADRSSTQGGRRLPRAEEVCVLQACVVAFCPGKALCSTVLYSKCHCSNATVTYFC